MNDKNIDLLKSSYHYDLPKELIAERPAANRTDSRLLYFNKIKNQNSDLNFRDIIDLLPENALLVANRSKVFPCRIFCQKTTGAKAEIFFLEIIKNQDGVYPCLIKSSSKKHIGDEFTAGELKLCIKSRYEDGTFGVSVDGLNGSSLEEFLFEKGNVPIPPYIRGGVSDEDDKKRYQTVFCKIDPPLWKKFSSRHQLGIFQSYLALNSLKFHILPNCSPKSFLIFYTKLMQFTVIL